MNRRPPITVEVVRGDMVESRHACAAAIFDASGTLRHAWGDIERNIYPRSAIKPLQALPLIESGAAEAYRLSESEISLACASHNGERYHVERVARWLKRIDCTEKDLECGPHRPYDLASADELVRDGRLPDRLNNNCSGKHAGFLTYARHVGLPTLGYSRPDHPVQQGLVEVLSDLGGVDLEQTERGTDGCGIPIVAMPLAAMALALARMADPTGLDAGRRNAADRIVGAITANPYELAGRDRFDTAFMAAAPKRFVVKTGAEAVHAAIIPESGLGVALKAEDGAKRASEAAMAHILKMLGVIDADAEARLGHYMVPPVVNSLGARVGFVRLSDGWHG